MPEITVTVKCSNDQKYSVTIDTSKTVLEFKNAIAEKSNTAADKQRLIYSGRVLKDNDTLETYKITEGHTVHMVRSQASTATQNHFKTLSPCSTEIFALRDSSQTSSRTTSSATTSTTSENPPPTTQPGVPPFTFPPTNPFIPTPFGYGGSNQNPYGFPNANLMMMEQIMQNPVMMQRIQQMIQDPTFIDSMIAMYPNLSQLEPQIRQMFQDPEVLALMSNPEVIRNMATMNPNFFNGSGGGGIPGFPGSNTPATTNNNATTNPSDPSSRTTNADTTSPTNPATPANNLPFFNPTQAFIPLFDPTLLGALAMPPTASPAAPQIPPEERFQVQLRQLNEMGFFDAQKNIRALQVCQGDVNLAIERLLDPSFN
ncbi:229_t:CDS:2 [Acaulospora colombiana]|uniref:229_t:CDS:1 n=1 Tax=Acaulospora colombiana TaxID=27376 RepID=A0ACA9KT14_9GLOM|nr:229_t:CDS:2 [Acaulospora colombiana]